MVLIVLLVLALFVVQTVLPNRFREPGNYQGKIPEGLGNRDHLQPLTVIGQRAARALANMQEAMPVFLALALLNLIVGTAAGAAITGATIFLVARVVYVGIYMAGIPIARTLAWMVSWAGLVMMIIPLLDKI